MMKTTGELLAWLQRKWRGLRGWQVPVGAALVIGAGVGIGALAGSDCTRPWLIAAGIGAAAGAQGAELAQRTFAWAGRFEGVETGDEGETNEQAQARRADEFPPAGFLIGILLALVAYGFTQLID